MHRFVVNVEVAVVRGDRYLAIERGAGVRFGAGWLVFPGGKMEPEPVLADALEATGRREVREEVGLELDEPIAYVESHTFELPDGGVVLDVVLLARAAEGEASRAAPDEVASVAWLSFEALMADPRTQAWTRTSLALAEAKRQALGW